MRSFISLFPFRVVFRAKTRLFSGHRCADAQLYRTFVYRRQRSSWASIFFNLQISLKFLTHNFQKTVVNLHPHVHFCPSPFLKCSSPPPSWTSSSLCWSVCLEAKFCHRQTSPLVWACVTNYMHTIMWLHCKQTLYTVQTQLKLTSHLCVYFTVCLFA